MGREYDMSTPAPADDGFRLTPQERGAPRRRPAARTPLSTRKKIYVCRFCSGRWRDVDWFLYHPCVQARFRALIEMDFAAAPTEARKCSPFARARTRNLSVITREVAEARAIRTRRHPRRLPMYREDCPVQRPCGYVSCRHHNAFEVDEDNGSIKEILPRLRIMDDPAGPGLLVLEAVMGTCNLDMGDGQDDGSRGVNALQELRDKAIDGRPIGDPENGMTLEETAKALGISIERVRQLGASGMQKVRLAIWQQEGRHRG